MTVIESIFDANQSNRQWQATFVEGHLAANQPVNLTIARALKIGALTEPSLPQDLVRDSLHNMGP
ncbi:hypothetical protein D3C76_1667040 [compost metagenome]